MNAHPVPLQAVCFDMDGLLVETESLWFRSETAVMAALGAQWSETDQAACLGGPLPHVGRYMADKAGRGDPETIVADLVDGVEMLFATEPLHWMPGARELLSLLRDEGIPRALVSASPRRLVHAVLTKVVDSLGEDAFLTTVSSNDVERTKPFPDPYLEACRRLEVDPAATVVLEDSPNGSAAGLAAGCLVIGVPHIAPIQPAPRLVTVGSLSEVSLDFIAAALATA
jgi:HAD superfamily hydrolase (TIGR01509 family)